MHTRTSSSQTVAEFVDQVAVLDDAPDRTVCPWFYADLARLAADAIDDCVTTDLGDLAAEQRQDAYNQGHDAGYRRGRDDARRNHRAAATATHRTAHRRQPGRGGAA